MSPFSGITNPEIFSSRKGSMLQKRQYLKLITEEFMAEDHKLMLLCPTMNYDLLGLLLLFFLLYTSSDLILINKIITGINEID
jgi:hypothetical protein